MKVAHLAGRFFGALWPAAPRAADVEWVQAVLTDSEFVEFRRQPNHDQRHAIGVARDVVARLAGTPYAGDERWAEAALLHDIGKLDSHLGVYSRVVATLSGHAAGHDMAEAWSTRRQLHPPGRLYLRHARARGQIASASPVGRRRRVLGCRPPPSTSGRPGIPSRSSPPSTADNDWLC
jgi:hypothetical protein